MSIPSPSAQALFHDGTRLLEQGSPQHAEAALRAALARQPDFGEAHANLALTLDRGGRDVEAEHHYRRALELMPAHDQAWTNFGAMLERQKRYAESEDAHRRALMHNPGSAVAWSNLGVLLDNLRRDAESEHCVRTALALAPGWEHAEFNLGLLLLRLGRFEEGWRRLEARDWYGDMESHIGIPRWREGSPDGLAVLVGVDSGHGDMIQFCRYCAELKRRGAACVGVLCHPGLKALFERVDGIDHVIAIGMPGEPLPDVAWDVWCPMLSLPHLCGTRLETIPADLPYLRVDPARVARWVPLVAAEHGVLRVGLVWKGNPRFANDAERSLPSLHTLAPLGRVCGVRFVSLQKGAGEVDVLDAPFPIEPLGPAIADFADTAAILANLDLLITVDTAPAHLAGAMGLPCWVLLPRHKMDWRWMDDRADSPWYPGAMRLFRQLPGDGWGDVVEQVATALADAVARRDPVSGSD